VKTVHDRIENGLLPPESQQVESIFKKSLVEFKQCPDWGFMVARESFELSPSIRNAFTSKLMLKSLLEHN
jgi:hypothetical protein